MTTPPREVADALQEAARAIMASPDPAGAISSLRRWARRRTEFDSSPAAQSVEDIAAARSAGVPLHLAALRRVTVNDQPTKENQP